MMTDVQSRLEEILQLQTVISSKFQAREHRKRRTMNEFVLNLALHDNRQRSNVYDHFPLL